MWRNIVTRVLITHSACYRRMAQVAVTKVGIKQCMEKKEEIRIKCVLTIVPSARWRTQAALATIKSRFLTAQRDMISWHISMNWLNSTAFYLLDQQYRVCSIIGNTSQFFQMMGVDSGEKKTTLVAEVAEYKTHGQTDQLAFCVDCQSSRLQSQ